MLQLDNVQVDSLPFQKLVENYLKDFNFRLVDEKEKIEKFNQELNDFVNQNQREKKKKKRNAHPTGTSTPSEKKQKVEIVQQLSSEENFIVCGRVNSRGKPCLRRKGTCPYHNED
jgi:hypothetical protein